MRLLSGALVALVVIAAPAAQSPGDVLADTRLSVHTLLREDVFAGFRNDDLTRLDSQYADKLVKASGGAPQPAAPLTVPNDSDETF